MATLEELKAKMEAAQENSRQANTAARDATDLYNDALLERTGFKGCVAEYATKRGFGQKATTVRFLVSSLGSWSKDEIRGKVIKADGTVGEVTKQCRIAEAKNLGPYIAAASVQS